PGPSEEPPVHAVPPVRAVPDGPGPADDGTGLPSRRRRRPLAPTPQAAPAGTPDQAAAVRPVRTPEQAAARWQALQHGTGSGRAAVAEAEAVAEAAGTRAAAGTRTDPEAADPAGPGPSPHPPSPAATGPTGADLATPPRPDAARTGVGPADASGRRTTQTP
ncbi:hypothetical protein ACFVFS_09950, partial [Kitasatospora sp. NPDC057692]